MALGDDVTTALADLLALGLACSATYSVTAGSVTVAFEDDGQPPAEDVGGEITRREAWATLDRNAVTSTPTRGATLTVASGTWAGTWVIIEVGPTDDGSWRIRCRIDTVTRVRAAGTRRLPGEA